MASFAMASPSAFPPQAPNGRARAFSIRLHPDERTAARCSIGRRPRTADAGRSGCRRRGGPARAAVAHSRASGPRRRFRDSVGAARKLLAGNRYALCLTDMRLPDGTGIELVREVAARGDTPIAVITAYGSAENAVAALKAGAFDYLAKPVDLDQAAAARPLGARPAAGGRRAAAAARARDRPLARRCAGDAPASLDDRAARPQHGAGGHLRRVGQRQGAGRARDP